MSLLKLDPQIFKVIFDDLSGKKFPVLDNETHILSALEWLKYAQDKSGDGGVSAWYSLLTGWAPSYIETTGYIISTFLDCSKYFQDESLKKRAIKMADFLLSMQLPSGGFRSKLPSQTIDSKPEVFDTGQDIIGLVDIYRFTKQKKYLESAIKAADFLCSIQEENGSWLKYTYGSKVATYHTRVAWSLLKIYQVTKKEKYKKHAVLNLEWARFNQAENGWFRENNFPPPNFRLPFTHNISYAIEGFLYSTGILHNENYLDVAKKTADVLLDYFNKHQFMPATFDHEWNSDDKYTCLTGDAQIAVIWLTLFKITGNKKYLLSAKKMNSYLKSIQNIKTGNANVRGAIKGSDPIYGDLSKGRGYCRMAYLNWATKFFVDALLMELKIGHLF